MWKSQEQKLRASVNSVNRCTHYTSTKDEHVMCYSDTCALILFAESPSTRVEFQLIFGMSPNNLPDQSPTPAPVSM